MNKIRLQKILVNAGYGSRRKCEEIIKQGRVTVNNVIASIGDQADLEFDSVAVDGSLISQVNSKKIYIALNKPRGILSEVDLNENRPSVRDLINNSAHLFCVGRLDKNSEGLILLTNDGDLAHHLTHPRYQHEKEYLVMVDREPDMTQLRAWRKGGVKIEDGFETAPTEVNIVSKQGQGNEVWLRVILREGRKRQIRRVGSKLGLPVKRIIRVRIGTLELTNLKPGEWKYLSPLEIKQLKNYVRDKKSGQ